MANFVDTYFGPLSKDSCNYFFILSVIFFIILIVALFMHFFFYIKNYKSINFKVVLNTIFILINIFLIYFVNRLFYTMCSKSLA
jgi:hypothetical protein